MLYNWCIKYRDLLLSLVNLCPTWSAQHKLPALLEFSLAFANRMQFFWMQKPHMRAFGYFSSWGFIACAHTVVVGRTMCIWTVLWLTLHQQSSAASAYLKSHFVLIHLQQDPFNDGSKEKPGVDLRSPICTNMFSILTSPSWPCPDWHAGCNAGMG